MPVAILMMCCTSDSCGPLFPDTHSLNPTQSPLRNPSPLQHPPTNPHPRFVSVYYFGTIHPSTNPSLFIAKAKPFSLLLQQQVFGQAPPLDPFALVKDELESVSERLRRSLSTNIPALGKAAGYFFQLGAEGKRLRPTMLLLMASALSPLQDSGNYLTVDERPPNVHPTEER